jgi:hypothetical protein
MLDFFFGWLKRINWRRVTVLKSVIIIASFALSAAIYLAYSNWPSIIEWATKKPEPQVAARSCLHVEGDLKLESGAILQVVCPDGKVEGGMTIWPKPSPPQVAAQTPNWDQIARVNELHLVALSLIGPRQFTPAMQVAATVPAPAVTPALDTKKIILASDARRKAPARTRVADARPPRKSSKVPDDPFLLRTFRAIPQEESITAFQPVPPMTGSCFDLPFMTCYEPTGYGREALVRVDDATQRIIRAHGLY